MNWRIFSKNYCVPRSALFAEFAEVEFASPQSKLTGIKLSLISFGTKVYAL